MKEDYTWYEKPKEKEEDKKKKRRRKRIISEPATSWDKGHFGYDPSGHGFN